MTRRVSSPTLVGRQREHSALIEILAETTRGRPSCVLLGGDAGIGKTRLLAAVAEAAQERGVRVLVGNCVELTDGHLPFAPVVQALRGFVRETDPTAVPDLVGSAAGELARLLPELGPPAEPLRHDGVVFDSSQGRLFEALLAFLGRLGERGGAMLVLEDLHWADDSTRDLLAFLIRNLRDEKLMLVGSYRSDELHRQHPLRPFLASVDNDKVERIQLDSLGRREVGEQLAGILESDPEPMLVDRIFERSEGNPFFVEELLAAGNDAPSGLPNTLRDALMVRVEILSPTAQQVVRVVAVAGRQVDHELLMRVMDLDEGELIEALREAVSRHLLEPGRFDDSYAFRHALLREAVYDDLLPGERTRLHSDFARVLKENPELIGARSAGAAAELAYHYYAAHDLASALVASVEAGRAAYNSLAFSESRRQYERALSVWDQVPDAASKANIDQVELLRSCGQSALLMADLERAAALFRSALRLVDEKEDPATAGLLHERVARSLWVYGHTEEALDEYKRAVELLPADPPSAARARVLATEAQILMLSQRLEESVLRVEEALEVARSVGAREEEGHALATLGSAIAGLGDLETGLGYIYRAREIAREVGNVDDLARTYANAESSLSLVGGRTDDAVKVCREGIALVKELGLERYYGRWLKNDLAANLARMGEWDEASDILDDVGDSSIAQVRAFTQVWKAQIAIGRGDLATASAELKRMSDVGARVADPQFQGPYRQTLALHALWAGDYEGAQAAVDEGLRRFSGTDEVVEALVLYWLGVRSAADRAQAARARRDEARITETRERASTLVSAARGLVDEARAAGRVYATLDPCDLSITAEWSRVVGEPDADLWAGAATAWMSLQQPYEAAYMRWREAEAAVSSNDRDRSERAAREAFGIAVKLGARSLVAELESLARRARLKLELVGNEIPAQVDGGPEREFGLTPREMEVLHLVVEGKTNPQIAEELFISEKTASVHVSHILQKMGVSGRVEAATVAHRLGL